MSATTAPSQTDHAQPPRLLVAEDSSITQDLLKLVLSQRGYAVDIVDSGTAALEALRDTPYDVALLDFHLPGMDGVEVVSAYTADTAAPHPRFIAITGDAEGLLSHAGNCEQFDEIIPKPVDIEEVCRVLETPRKTPEAGDKPARRSGPVAGTPDSGAEASGFLSHLLETFAFLVWPDDFDADHTGARVVQAGVNPSRIDGILIRTEAPVQRPERLWQRRGLHLLPAIDMTGTLGPIADLDGSRMSNSQADRIGSTVAEFHERRARVHRDLVMTDDSGEKLLARVYVSGRDLAPAYNDASALLATYSLPLADKDITDQAEKLVREGFLKKRFFDRTHACGGCGSAHLNVREECPACGSAQLNEHAYVHHFPCAYQGPEGDFRAGDDLVCPKCRKGLRHFGHDYDRPGTMIICQDCGHSTSEPDVGFVCISCSSHAKADAVTTRDIHTYTMTEKGSAFCEAGRAAAGLDKRGFRFADLPLELVVALNEAARIHNDEGTPFSLIDIAYRNQRLIEREDGARMFAIVRDQFIENLRQALSGKGQVLKGSAYDFALLPGVPAQQLRHRIDEVISLSTQDLNADLGVAMTIFSPQDLF